MDRPLRILMVEDSPDDCELVLHALRRSRIDPDWLRVETADELRVALTNEPWDAVLSDHSLPIFSSAAALAIVRAFDPELPFLVVSGTVGEEIAVEMMRAGANDYFLKHSLARLAPAVEREVREAANRRARRAAERMAVHLAAIVESSVDAIVSETDNGHLTSWNGGAERLYGWTAAEALGRHVSFLVPPDKSAERAGVVARIRAGERVGLFETVRLHKDGYRIDISLTISPMRDAEGRLIGLTKTGQDIRERKRALSALRTSENRLRAIFQAEPECVKVVSRAGHLLEMNPAGLAMLEIATLAEAQQHALTEFITPAYRDAFRELHRRVMDGRNGTLAYEIVGLKGTRRWLETHATPLRNDAGEIESLLGVTRDMTDRRQAEEALRNNEEQLLSFVENVSAPIAMLDRDMRYLHVSRRWLTDYNLGSRNIRWLSHYEVFPDIPPEWKEIHRRCLAGAVDRCDKARFERADGTVQWIRWEIRPWMQSREEIGGIMMFTEDITERIRSEEAIRQSEERYRSLVDATAAIVWDSPASGEFDTYQPGWSAFTSQTLEQHKGYGWLNGIHPEDREKSAKAWALAVRERGTYQMDHRVLRADGEYRDMTARAVPIFETDGTIREWVGVHTDVTEQKRAEEALRFQHALLRSQTESSPDGMLVVDPDLRVLSYNRRFLSLWGIPNEIAEGGDDVPMVAVAKSRVADPEGFASRVAEIYADGEMESHDEVPLADGRTLDRYSGAIRGTDGERLGRVWYFRDISDRKSAERIRDERARLSSLVGDVGIALSRDESLGQTLQACTEAAVKHLGAAFARIWTVSEDGGTLELQASAGMYTHLDGPHGRVPVGKFKIGRIAQERLPHLTNAVIGDPRVGDQAWAEKEGMVAFAGYPLIVGQRLMGVIALFAREPLPETTTVALASIADHIALGIEHAQTELALHSSRLRLQHVLVSSPAVLFTLGIEGKQIRGINWISDNVLALLGYTPAEALHPDWWRGNIHPEDREGVMVEAQEKLFGSGNITHEYRFRHKEGRYLWTRGEIRIIRDAEGRPLEAVGSWSDISEHKRLEDQFHQSQKMEAFGQLAGGVAHDFNNLLTIINGYSDLLLQTLPPQDPSREMIDEIHKAGERSAGLTRQLLAFSRQSILAPRVIDLNGVVSDTDKMLRRLIGEDIRLTTTLDSKLAAVRADPGQIEQVLMNLAVNARDAMPRGGRLTIETRNSVLDESYAQTHADVRAGRYAALSVTDTGEGMPPDVLGRIFEPFYTTKGPGKGTGLGLATVYGIVKQSGGHLAVYSEVGVGTSFKVYLPRIDKSLGDSAIRAGIVDMRKGTETILIAEDEAAVRNLTRLFLSGLGYTVLQAADGIEAARMAAGHAGPIHLLITDVVMPGSGGRAASEEVVARHPETRVLFISGYTDDAVIRHGVLREGVQFLQKPYSRAALAAKVREILDSPG